MIRNPIDIASRVSPELTGLIETVISQLETDEPVTLAAIRSFIANDLPGEIDDTEHMHHFDVDESVVDELDELIGQFGESAAAMDFIYAFASEQLTRVIEEVVNDENRENPPSLEDVREAILGGLAGSLVGEGVLDEDEDDVLLPEIEDLIDRFGADALAEDFLRYE
ncbi:MAG: hypothetical protein NUV63_02115 [Gallionella sp.]|nr:hypothetical protein [Gallionella sp.]